MKPTRPSGTIRTGLARALSKLGVCSRSEAWKLIESGRVQLNGRICRDPEKPVFLDRDIVSVNGCVAQASQKIYLMLNKPRGLVTSTADEQGRDTVYECFAGHELPRIIPVGRLDKASEGLLLFTNDTAWANAITDPIRHLDKTYHVQINQILTPALLASLEKGREIDGELLAVKRVTLLREGEKNSWLEIILDEGKNRHIRRLLEAFGIEVLRLIRVAIGSLPLGNLPKGAFRKLSNAEQQALVPALKRRNQE